MNACKDKNCFTYYRHKDPTPWTCPKCQTIWRVNNAEWEKVATKKDEPANMTSTLERATKFLDYRLTGSEGVIAISIMAEFADTLIAERDAEIDAIQVRCLDLEKTLNNLIVVIKSVQTETNEEWVSRCLADAVSRSQTAMDFADSVLGEKQ